MAVSDMQFGNVSGNVMIMQQVGDNISGDIISGEVNVIHYSVKTDQVRLLNILKQGAVAWNEWRKKSPDVKIDLFKADLRKADLCGANLRGANLREADLRGANLREANLEYSQLVYTNLTGANITEAYLYGTAKDDWVIDGIQCDCVYWSPAVLKNLPK